MRLNFFQYHVQDRDYSSVEVAELINNSSNKHLILANSEYSYSSGTIAELTTSYIVAPAIIIAAVVGIIYVITTTDSSESSSDNKYIKGSSGNINIDNSFNTNNNTNNFYKAIDIPNDQFTAREVTKFMNEYYDYPFFHVLRDVRNKTIISNFINHKYVDAEVPTLGNSHWFPIAVLDTYD